MNQIPADVLAQGFVRRGILSEGGQLTTDTEKRLRKSLVDVLVGNDLATVLQRHRPPLWRAMQHLQEKSS